MMTADISKLVAQALPMNKRGLVTTNVIMSMLAVVRTLYNRTISERDKQVRRAQTTSQVLSLQSYLRWLVGNDGVTITDSPWLDSPVFYTREETYKSPVVYYKSETDSFINPVLYTNGEDLYEESDFTVTISQLNHQGGKTPLISAAVEEFKFADKKHSINIEL